MPTSASLLGGGACGAPGGTSSCTAPPFASAFSRLQATNKLVVRAQHSRLALNPSIRARCLPQEQRQLQVCRAGITELQTTITVFLVLASGASGAEVQMLLLHPGHSYLGGQNQPHKYMHQTRGLDWALVQHLISISPPVCGQARQLQLEAVYAAVVQLRCLKQGYCHASACTHAGKITYTEAS